MALVSDSSWPERVAALPLESFNAGDTVFAEGTKTGRLLVLKSGAVSISKSGRKSRAWPRRAPCSASSRRCSTCRTPPMCMRWSRRISCRRRDAIVGRSGGAFVCCIGVGAARRRRQFSVARTEAADPRRRATEPARQDRRQDRRHVERDRFGLPSRRRRDDGYPFQ